VGGVLLQCQVCPAGGQAQRWGLSVIPSPRVVAGMVRCDKVRGGRDQSEARPRRVGVLLPDQGVMTCTIRAHREVRGLLTRLGRIGSGCGDHASRRTPA
jgi:hypothetical protein